MISAYKWSGFNLLVPDGARTIVKNTLTGAVAVLNDEALQVAENWLNNPDLSFPEAESLVANGILVPADTQEHLAFVDSFKRAQREGDCFILHFIPTLQCQLSCEYCFENGVDRGRGMHPDVMRRGLEWLRTYFVSNPEIKVFKVVLFGGEPLVRKDIVRQALPEFESLAAGLGLEFFTEILTNGELLDEDMARTLARYSWKRLQVTLDGPRSIHDRRRFGKNGRPTFDVILRNLKYVLAEDLIERIDVRISFDLETADGIPELLQQLKQIVDPKRLNVSFGLIRSTVSHSVLPMAEDFLARAMVGAWKRAKELGYDVPDEYVAGPFCVATATHSATLTPTGLLYKCFCTVGRPGENVADIRDDPPARLTDDRYEGSARMSECVEGKCELLPICGGNCINDAVISLGKAGFTKRLCEKDMLIDVNTELLRLNFGSPDANSFASNDIHHAADQAPA